jgi:hypothetical protein
MIILPWENAFPAWTLRLRYRNIKHRKRKLDDKEMEAICNAYHFPVIITENGFIVDKQREGKWKKRKRGRSTKQKLDLDVPDAEK